MLQRAHDKHGMDALRWDMLEQLPEDADKYVLEEAEQKWIDLLKPRYNASESVKRHLLGRKLGPQSVETREKIRKANTGFKHSEETKAKMRGKRGPLKLTDEQRTTRREQGKALSARGLSEEARKKIARARTGVKQKPETLIKRSESLKGRPWTEARREAMATGKKAGSPAGKPWSEARRAAEKVKYPFGRSKQKTIA